MGKSQAAAHSASQESQSGTQSLPTSNQTKNASQLNPSRAFIRPVKHLVPLTKSKRLIPFLPRAMNEADAKFLVARSNDWNSVLPT